MYKRGKTANTPLGRSSMRCCTNTTCQWIQDTFLTFSSLQHTISQLHSRIRKVRKTNEKTQLNLLRICLTIEPQYKTTLKEVPSHESKDCIPVSKERLWKGICGSHCTGRARPDPAVHAVPVHAPARRFLAEFSGDDDLVQESRR